MPADACPKCGSDLPANDPGGPCPGCLLAAGLGDETGATVSRTPGSDPHPTVAGSGTSPVTRPPQVALRDTDAIEPADGTTLPPGEAATGPSSPGERAGRLTVFDRDEIGSGGMGVVLRGRDSDLGRDLAIKTLKPAHADDPDLARRLVKEAQISGQLQHFGVVPVHEFGHLGDSRPYFAMKLVKGRTLAKMLEERADPAQDLPRYLAIFEVVAQTMAYAHSRAVLHRDLKPSNVMVGAFGEVHVMDWGLAKVLAGDAGDDAEASREETVISTSGSGSGGDATRPGGVLGTPPHMAPEQARGEPVDLRADVFSLGSILCAILTGTPAFTGPSANAIVLKSSRGDLADAFARLDACGADPELIALAKACLAPDRDDRPGDAKELSDRVTAYIAGVQDRLRKAEVARAAELARAEEAIRTAEAETARAEAAEAGEKAERRARKFQVGLAASLLALSTVGGLAFLYMVQQRQARTALAGRMLGEARTLLTQARERPEDPSRWRAAREATRRVEDAPGVRAGLAELNDVVASGLAAAESDAALRQALFEARVSQTDFGARATDAAFTRAWRAAGLDIDALAPVEVAARIKKRPPEVASDLIGYLDYWSNLRRTMARRGRIKDADDSWRQPLLIARAADSDPYRDHLRALLANGEPKAQASALRSLADDPRAGDLAPPTAILLAESLAQVKELDEIPLLRAMVAKHPQEIWANQTLAAALERMKPARREEALRYYSVARGLRPEMAHDMAHLLIDMGLRGEAEAVFRDLTTRLPKHGMHLACFGNLLRARGKDEGEPTRKGDLIDEAASVLDRAIAASHDAISLAPDNWMALKILGDALSDRGRHDEAVAALREAARLAPDEVSVQNNLGLALRRKGDHDAAISVFREALRLEPDDEKLHNNLADALEGKGLLDESIREHREAIRLRPEYGKFHEDLAHVLIKSNRIDEAITEYRESLRLEPEDAACLSNLGNALETMGDHEEAASFCREAVRLRPTMAEGHLNLGNALLSLKKFEQAVAECREAIRLGPDDANSHNSLGHALMRTGKWQEALEEYRVAIRLEPRKVMFRYNLGLSLLELARPVEAEIEVREAIRIQRDDDAAWSSLGSVLIALGRLDEATAAYREAIHLKPEIAIYHNNLSYSLILSDHIDEAMAANREALRLQPDLAIAHSTLAMILAAQGQAVGALAEFREAIRLDPDQPNVHSSLGAFLCDKSHDYEGAIIAFHEAIRLAPLEPRYHFNLGNALRGAKRFDEAIAAYHEAIRLGEGGDGVYLNMGLAQFDKRDWNAARNSFQKASRLADGVLPKSPVLDDMILRTEQQIAIAKRLPGVIAGTDRPKDTTELLDFAMACGADGFFASAARLFGDAFAADPKLAADIQAPHRFNAARAAAQAGTGRGNEFPKPDEATKAKLRERSRGWLNEQLKAWRRIAMTAGDPNRPAVAENLAHLKAIPDLSGVRDPETLAKLPEAEREAWRAFWGEVDALLAKLPGGRR